MVKPSQVIRSADLSYEAAWQQFCVFDRLRSDTAPMFGSPPERPSKVFNFAPSTPTRELRDAMLRTPPPKIHDREPDQRLVFLVGHDPFMPLPRDQDEKLSAHETAKRLFNEAFVDARLTPESTEAQRIKVCWRICRELATRLDLINPDEPLTSIELPIGGKDPWAEGTFPVRLAMRAPMAFRKASPLPVFANETKAFLNSPPLHQPARKGRIEIVGLDEAVYQTAFLHPSKMTQIQVEAPEGGETQSVPMPGLTLLPPPLPAQWETIDGEPLEGYDADNPMHDPLLALWLQAAYRIVKHLHIEAGSKLDPTLGKYGLMGLFEPSLVRTLFPTRTQILFWEAMLVEEVGHLLITKSVVETKKYLIDKYGFEDYETANLISLGRNNISLQYTGTTEETDKHMMLAKLEDYIRRSREALNLDAEFKALKQMALIQGLSEQAEDGGMKDFVEAVRKIGVEKHTRAADRIVGSSRAKLLEG